MLKNHSRLGFPGDNRALRAVVNGGVPLVQCHAALIVRDWHEIASHDATPDSKSPHCTIPVADPFEAFRGQLGRRRIPVAIHAR